MQEETGQEEQDQHRRAEGRMEEIEAIHTTETKGCAHNINNRFWSCASLSVRSVFAEKGPSPPQPWRRSEAVIFHEFVESPVLSPHFLAVVQTRTATNFRHAGRRLSLGFLQSLSAPLNESYRENASVNHAHWPSRYQRQAYAYASNHDGLATKSK